MIEICMEKCKSFNNVVQWHFILIICLEKNMETCSCVAKDNKANIRLTRKEVKNSLIVP